MDDLKKYCKKCQNWQSFDFYGKKITCCMCNMDYKICVLNKHFREEDNNGNIR